MKDKIKSDFANLLSDQRKSQSETQEGLSRKAGLSLRFLQDLEAGRKLPSIESIIRLCMALKITPDDLLVPIMMANKDALDSNEPS
ncbi:helix-turn-helix domain-containing protein [uncultured Pseudoteredinibacter sp.]|uniref:helix-turn-helix domain-containing protein n=1 Tax=uncultured Pseudoteredinibacter sp. TaxID=1641701 RepID=UPI002613B763|nr:helix-turn-helix domain-containing protein [uncultured Pseudoteredinibacter sp.]